MSRDPPPAERLHFWSESARRHGRSISGIPDHVMEALESYDWPGNVCELQNFLERSAILSKGKTIEGPVNSGTSSPTVVQ